MEINPKAPSFRLSADSKKVVDRLSQCKPGDKISWLELTKIIGRNAQNGGRGAVTTARRILLRDYKLDFGCIHGFGLQCLTGEETTDDIHSRPVRQHRNIAKRAMQRAEVVNMSDLTEDGKRKYLVTQAREGAITLFTKPASQRKIEQAINDSGKLERGDLLKLFGS